MTAAKPKKVKEKFLGEKRHSCRFFEICLHKLFSRGSRGFPQIFRIHEFHEKEGKRPRLPAEIRFRKLLFNL